MGSDLSEREPLLNTNTKTMPSTNTQTNSVVNTWEESICPRDFNSTLQRFIGQSFDKADTGIDVSSISPSSSLHPYQSADIAVQVGPEPERAVAEIPKNPREDACSCSIACLCACWKRFALALCALACLLRSFFSRLYQALCTFACSLRSLLCQTRKKAVVVLKANGTHDIYRVILDKLVPDVQREIQTTTDDYQVTTLSDNPSSSAQKSALQAADVIMDASIRFMHLLSSRTEDPSVITEIQQALETNKEQETTSTSTLDCCSTNTKPEIRLENLPLITVFQQTHAVNLPPSLSNDLSHNQVVVPVHFGDNGSSYVVDSDENRSNLGKVTKAISLSVHAKLSKL